jgi:hypothetical protein
MSFACSWPLQKALFAALAADPAVGALAGARIWDEGDAAAVLAAGGGPCVILGDETVEPWSTASDEGAAHVVTISALSEAGGFSALKRLAGAVCDVALAPLTLERGRVVSSRFLGGRTRREEKGRARRVELRFRIVVEDLA